MKEIYEKGIQPILPKNFDENEWYALVITVLISICVYFITVKKRRFLWSEIICISLLNLQMTTIGDYFLAMPPYDFYDTVDRNSGELTDIFLQNITYPGTVLLLMHIYKVRNLNKVCFLLASTVLLSLLEAISVFCFHLFTYKTWEFYYSVLFYFFVMAVNLIFYEKLNAYLKKRRGCCVSNG
jgi:hypothetical protein